MKNVFDEQQDANLRIDRDTFDWTHANNFTAKLGTIYPVFRRLMPPNTKLKIKTDLGLQFMPMSFPVQTPMKCKVSFFKIPLRTLWKDYMDYVGNFKQGLEEPYHDISNQHFDKFFGECQLADYLDIPNIVYGTFGSELTSNVITSGYTFLNNSGQLVSPEIDSYINSSKLPPSNTTDITYSDVYLQMYGRVYEISQPLATDTNYKLPEDFLTNPTYFVQQTDVSNFYTPFNPIIGVLGLDEDGKVVAQSSLNNAYTTITKLSRSKAEELNIPNIYNLNEFYEISSNIINIPSPESDLTGAYFKFDTPTQNIKKIVIGYLLSFRRLEDPIDSTIEDLAYNSNIVANSADQWNYLPDTIVLSDANDKNYNAQYSVISPTTSPYFSSQSNPTGKKLSAYSARAYEAVYNSYIRDPRNNPLLDSDGQPVYNHWLLNYDGGADSYPYELHKDNWEKDFLTTAVHSPQQGIAPLVGLTQYVTQNDDNLQYNLSLVDEDGKKYSVNYELTEENGTKSYTISVGDELEDGTNILQMTPKQLMDSANMGFSIPDLRIVNAYQKYLELNIRKSFSYKDIIQGRFDCKVRFDELQMPEFLGGFTRDIQMNRVVQSVDNNISTDTPTYERSLGSLAGDAYLNNPNSPDISVFCDEECIVLGLMRIVPIPVYSQLLPKDYLYRDILDHFNPEFNNLGMQPISYAEVCPLQAKMFGVSLDDTFGYQRAWYEYVYMNDTSHGLMRTTLRDFLMNRHFKEVPRLNESFLLVDEKQLNDVFQVQTDEDKIIGQFIFQTTVELPINRVQIPKIE